MTMLRWLRFIEDLLFPPSEYCPLCGEHGLRDLECCAHCFAALNPDWLLKDLGGRTTASLFAYREYGRLIVQQMKFHGGYRTAVAIGALLGRALKETPEFADVDFLVPVPLHPERMRQRGYNQTEALVHGIRTHWKKPVLANVSRVQNTPAQSRLTLPERQANLRRAFALVTETSLAGKTCLVVDDVVTTGSTFAAMCQVLEAAGADCRGVFCARALLESSEKKD